MSEQHATATAASQASRNLVIRVAAALVLAPLAVAAAYAGGRYWIALVTVAAIGLSVEWLAIVAGAQRVRVTLTSVAALAVAGFCLAFGRIDGALAALTVGLAGVALLSAERRNWSVCGFLYAAAAQLASVLLRHDPENGFMALVFVMLIVWVTDIGGYFAGRGIGGPKLWPRVSPQKTWAGAIGGFAASVAVAGAFAAFSLGKALPLLGLGAGLSVVAQFGDLFESAVKRRFRVKDSSHIIPGHGGLMDRLDGYVAATVLAAVLGLLRGGLDGAGRGLMVW